MKKGKYIWSVIIGITFGTGLILGGLFGYQAVAQPICVDMPSAGLTSCSMTSSILVGSSSGCSDLSGIPMCASGIMTGTTCVPTATGANWYTFCADVSCS